MAGMMMFDNAGTFKKGYANGLAGLAYNSQGAERESALGKLANVDAGYAQELKSSYDKQDYADLIDAAGILRAVRGTPQEGQAWASLKPRIEQKYGFQLPEMPDESVWGVIDQITAAQSGATDNVQSTFIDPEGKLNYLSRGGKTVNTGKRVSDKYSPMVDPVTGQVSGYSSRGNNLAPTAAGGQSSGMTEGDLTTYLNALNTKSEELRAAGVPPEQINAWADEQVANLPKVFGANPSQAQMGVKPAGQMTDYQSEMLALAKQKEAQAAADRKAKIDNAKAKGDEAAKKRTDAVVMSTDLLINNIDALFASDGYKNLGSVKGDAYTNVPLMRTAEKDAQATLDNIGGQVALTTMNNLKTLSAAGATGFGALSAPELALLKNSLSALEAGKLSHEALDKNLNTVRTYMQKIRDANTGKQSPNKPKSGRFTIEEVQ